MQQRQYETVQQQNSNSFCNKRSDQAAASMSDRSLHSRYYFNVFVSGITANTWVFVKTQQAAATPHVQKCASPHTI